jgi:hypothetical protein
MKFRRFVVASDNHGDMIDPIPSKALFDFLDDFKPEIRIHAGDNWDFRNLRKGASDDEKAHSLEDDWKSGCDFFEKFFKNGKENHFLLGNHDDRLWQYQRSATGLLRDYAADGIQRVENLCSRMKVKKLPYDSALGILKLGKLSILHGYHAGVGAARHHANIYGNCLFGHVHTDESAPVASLEPAEARTIPCLCIRDMDYINSKTGKLRWAQGWVFGLLFDDGTYHIERVRGINGKFTYATGFKTI